jgi:hypothetical protein
MQTLPAIPTPPRSERDKVIDRLVQLAKKRVAQDKTYNEDFRQILLDLDWIDTR